LKPGQQAQSVKAEKIKLLQQVDVDKVMAWKNGYFNFQDANLQEVMRQLERWYDIEVVYEKGVPELEFFGKMGKDLSLAAVLRGLEKSNVHFRFEDGRKLVVLP
jgi:transmembrane sensor